MLGQAWLGQAGQAWLGQVQYPHHGTPLYLPTHHHLPGYLHALPAYLRHGYTAVVRTNGRKHVTRLMSLKWKY